MTFELIQSDYYEEIGKTNFAKDLREEHNLDDLDWMYESRYRRGGVGGRIGGGDVGGVGGAGNGVGINVGVVGVGGIGDIGIGDGGDGNYDN
jgi:hypothetical protein